MSSISFFIGSLGRGGAERVISILANQFSEMGWSVDVCLLLENKVGYKMDDHINIIDMTESGTSYYGKLGQWLKKIRKYLKKRNPDRIVSFIGRINVLVLCASFGLGIKTIVSERNDPKHDGRGKLMLTVCNLTYFMADKVVFQTSYEKSCFSKLLNKKGYIVVNPITVNINRNNYIKNRIVSVGRLLPQKNHEMVIHAVKKLIDEGRDVYLDIYGGGYLENDLKALVKDLGLSDNIVIHGNVSDVHERIKDAHVFVMASKFEGLSNALIEAMMIGIPCISTKYPGINEVITDKKNGILVEQNDVIGLKNAISCILDNKQYADKISIAAKEDVHKFRKEEVIKCWIDLIV